MDFISKILSPVFLGLALAIFLSCADNQNLEFPSKEEIRQRYSSSDTAVSSSSSEQSSSSVLKECEIIFNPVNRFCYDGTVYDKCDGIEYNPTSQICENDVTITVRCNGAGYNPLINDCCSNSVIFSKSTQRCTDNNIVETKCGNEWYDASNTDLQCQSDIIVTKCGSEWYNSATQFCKNSSIVKDICNTETEQCCGESKYNPETQYCHTDDETYSCGNKPYNPETDYCHTDNKTYSCSGNPYNPSEQFCGTTNQGAKIYDKCGGKDYDPSKQFCYNSKIGDFCDLSTYSQKRSYNLDLYECKQGSKGIYLKEGITDTRDNNKHYNAVLIGEQVWMAENLNYNVTNSKCYNYDSYGESYCNTYGRLYDWATAMGLNQSYNTASFTAPEKHQGICPSGWHIPSDEDWDTLIKSIPGCSTDDCYGAGTKLKVSSYWNGTDNTLRGTDDYGFSACREAVSAAAAV